MPVTLSDWPWVVVRVDCTACRRRGCYRLARLAAKYGPEQSIAGLLRDLAADCPWYNERPRKDEPRCGARFPDLERAFPPPDHPDEPVGRQRQPEREDLPKPPRAQRFPAVSQGQGPLLSGWAWPRLGYHCRRCPRREVFAKASLLARYGDKPLTVLLNDLTADCPRRGSTGVYELCSAMFIVPDR